MKKILLIMVMVGSLVSGAFGVNLDIKKVQKIEQNIIEIKDKISLLGVKNQQKMIETKYFDPSHVDKRILHLQDKLADLYYKLAEIQGRTINLSKSVNLNDSLLLASAKAVTITPETGDIIIFKPKENYATWWAFAGNGWQHAAVFYSSNELVQALEPGKNSVKMSWNDFANNYPFYMMDQVILIKMNLSSSEKSNIQFYMNTFQIGIPYPALWQIPFTKYSIDTFYCSSLVWAAHKWSAKKIDLDSITSPAMVWPSELVSTVNYSQLYSVSW